MGELWDVSADYFEWNQSCERVESNYNNNTISCTDDADKNDTTEWSW